jgi:hypothetical protein
MASDRNSTVGALRLGSIAGPSRTHPVNYSDHQKYRRQTHPGFRSRCTYGTSSPQAEPLCEVSLSPSSMTSSHRCQLLVATPSGMLEASGRIRILALAGCGNALFVINPQTRGKRLVRRRGARRRFSGAIGVRGTHWHGFASTFEEA